MQITGTIKVIGQTQVVSDKFKKRELVITDNSSQYPQHIALQLTQDKCSLLDKFNIGDTITAHINLTGREWKSPTGETKYFNTIIAWRIEGTPAAQPQQEPAHFASATDDATPF